MSDNPQRPTGRPTDAEIEQLFAEGKLREAERVAGIPTKRCPACGRYQPHEPHASGCRMRKFLPWK